MSETDTPSTPDQALEPLNADSLIVEAELHIERKALKRYFKERGIKCLDCPAAEIESFVQGAEIHGFDVTEHLEDLNKLAASDPFDLESYRQDVWWRKAGKWLLRAAQDKN